MDRTTRIVVSVGAVALLATLALAAPALAQEAGEGGSGPGTGIGGLIKSIAGPIVWSLGGLTALAAFLRRDIGIAFTALVITAILGLFVTDQGQVALEGFTNYLAGLL